MEPLLPLQLDQIQAAKKNRVQKKNKTNKKKLQGFSWGHTAALSVQRTASEPQMIEFVTCPPPIPTVYLTVSLELSFLIEDWLFKLEA